MMTSGRSRVAASIKPLAVANRADHLEVGVSQYSRQTVGDNRVIVSQEDRVLAGHATCPSIPAPTSTFTRAFIGIVACTRVPCCGPDTTLTVPPMIRARSDDADEPETPVLLSAVGGIESPPIIRDRDLRLITHLEELHIRTAGAGVCDDVPQCFLRDSVDAERSVRRDVSKISLRSARDRHSMCTPQLAAVRRQALHEPEVLQHGRMEIVRELANVACEPARLLLKLDEFLFELLREVILAQPLLETTEGDRDTSQLLADIVVQVPRDPRPFDFLRPDQPAGQILNLLMTRLQCRLACENPILGVLPFGDVDVASHVAGEAAVPSVLRNPRSQKPSVLAVGVAQSILQEERLPRFERRHVRVKAPLDVLGMDKVQPAVLSQLFERPAGQLLAEAVQIVE